MHWQPPSSPAADPAPPWSPVVGSRPKIPETVNNPMAEIETRLSALEAALAQPAAEDPAAAQAELRAALDRLRVSCAEQAAALELALHHPAGQMQRPGQLLRGLTSTQLFLRLWR